MLFARAAIVNGLSWLRRDIPGNWKTILFLGGLRGAISLVLALSLAENIPHREQMQAMVFGVVLFTLLVEGLTMQPLIKRSKVIQYSQHHQEYDRCHARVIATRAAQSRIQRMFHEGIFSEYTLKRMNIILDQHLMQMTEAVRASLDEHPFLYEEELADAWIETLRAQRNSLTGLFHSNINNEDIFSELTAEVDFYLVDPDSGWQDLLKKLEQTS